MLYLTERLTERERERERETERETECVCVCVFVKFGWVLWHINHCRLFNAISSLYTYIRYIGFSLVEFYGISTIIGYLNRNPL